MSEPELYSYILDICCDIFGLKPRAHWWEALRIGFLPKVPKRITLFDESKWKEVEKSFEKDIAGETEIYLAAWQLIFDSWLYIYEYYQTPAESIFKNLAKLTANNDAPPLRIAHCIRDLAYGDESRAEDLAAMVRSEDPRYREIFETCLWIPTPEEKLKEEKRKRKK